ncbi:unnamed protein product [Caenorhabditis bovis]|uniref:G-protein coupled receptors family 1 profile domain-containing protein n=1 Tax=Caenorhabditis bovis TaxID=2654633 RepID=A0A8S1FAM0_9PELO|nr:unnamed protein product [Caenorhabditis bovis]
MYNGACSMILTPYSIFISFIYVTCLILSLIGNAIVILTILGKRHRSRSITNFYLLNLAFADLLRSIICIPSTLLSELTQCWILSSLMCKIVAFLQPVGVCASAYTLAVIAVERYYAICRPLESRKWQTKKRALVTISVVWLFSFSANIASLFSYEKITKFTCDSSRGPTFDFVYQLYITFALLFVPLALMISLYGNVIFTLNTAINNDNPTLEQHLIEKTLPSRASFSDWFSTTINRVPSMKLMSKSVNFSRLTVKEKNSLSIPRAVSARASRRQSSFSSFLNFSPRNSFDSSMLLRSTNQEKILIAKKKVTRMLITLVIVFALCWVPSYMYWLIIRMADLMGNNLWSSSINASLTVLTYVSSMANPITYCFMNKSFRASVLAFFRKNQNHATRCSAMPIRRSPSPKESPPNIPAIKIDLVLENSVQI